jgi:hypothetical protein
MTLTLPQYEPRHTDITARLAAQGAMLEDLRAVVGLVSPETARADARRLVVDEDVLHRATLESRRLLFTKLALRYFPTDMPRAAARLVRVFQADSDPQVHSLVAYAMLLWNDALAFRLGQRWLLSKLKGPPFSAVTGDIERELERIAAEEGAALAWSDETRSRVARHYLGLLRDVGYATGSAAKKLRRPYIPPRVILFGVQLILCGGETPSEVPEHPLFRAMGLSISEVIEALNDLARDGLIDFALQGAVVSLKLKGGICD